MVGVLVGNHSSARLLVAERYQLAVLLVFLLCADRVDDQGDRALVVERPHLVVLVFLLCADRVDDQGDRALVDFGDDCRVAH